MIGNLYQVVTYYSDSAIVTVRAMGTTDARLKAAHYIERRMGMPAGAWEPNSNGVWVRTKNLALGGRGWQSDLPGLSGDPTCEVGYAWRID